MSSCTRSMEPSPIGTILLVSENVSQSHISSFPWRSLSQVFVGVPRYLVQPVCSACLQIALVRPQWGCDLDASSRRSARGKFSPVVVRAAEEHLVDPCGNILYAIASRCVPEHPSPNRYSKSWLPMRKVASMPFSRAASAQLACKASASTTSAAGGALLVLVTT